MKTSHKGSYRGQNQQAQVSHGPSGEGPSYPPPVAMAGNGGSNAYYESARGQLPSIQPPPQPMEGLQNNAMPPPFLTKTYVMVDDPATDNIVSWGPSNNSFVVWDPTKFAQELLPKYFKHANFASFVRQLNTYGFRKVDPDRWEFANEFFLRGQQHLLRGILRRKPNGHNNANNQSAVGPWVAANGGGAAAGQPGSVVHAVELGKYGLEGEIERLKRDKNVLMMELVRLRQAQQGSEQQIRVLAQRLEVQEKRQQQMMSSLAQMMQNPTLLAQLMQQADKAQQLNTGKKRRHAPPSDHGSLESDLSPPDTSGQIVMYQPQTQHLTDATNGTLPVHVQFLTSTSGPPSSGDTKTESDEHSLNLFDDMVFEDSVKLFVDGADMLSRRPSATLTEMPHPSPPSGESDGTPDAPSQPPSPLQLPFDPVLNPASLTHPPPSPLGGLVGLDGSIPLHTATGDVDVIVDPAHLGIENMQLGPGSNDSAGVPIAPGSSGVDANVNDGFWEQFLGPSSGGLETGVLDTCDGCEEGAVVGHCTGGLMGTTVTAGAEGRGES